MPEVVTTTSGNRDHNETGLIVIGEDAVVKELALVELGDFTGLDVTLDDAELSSKSLCFSSW